MWYLTAVSTAKISIKKAHIAPIRPVIQMKHPAIVYPTQTHIHDCHQVRPPRPVPIIILDEIIHVFCKSKGYSSVQQRTYYVERIRNPETDIIPRSPLPTLWLNRFQVVICEHELCRAQSRSSLYSLHLSICVPDGTRRHTNLSIKRLTLDSRSLLIFAVNEKKTNWDQ